MFVQKYPLPLRTLHWIIAVLVLLMIGLGWYMTGLPRDHPLHGTLYLIHKSTGTVVLLLVCMRLIVRISRPMPSLPLTVPRRDRKLAEASYFVVYLLLFAIPVSGYLMTNAFGMAVNWYGLFALPKVIGTHPDWGKRFDAAHVYLAYTLLVLVCIHVGAVVKHYVLDKVNLLPRMW